MYYILIGILLAVLLFATMTEKPRIFEGYGGGRGGGGHGGRGYYRGGYYTGRGGGGSSDTIWISIYVCILLSVLLANGR